ncbi:MAG: hypothetical protein IJ281_04325 [Clostridia bacterium]|nr:hypothetical protein [Clostridia bacterium]
MNAPVSAPRTSWNRAFCSAMFVLAVTALAVVSGFYLAKLLYGSTLLQLHIQSLDPYAGCDFFTEYAMCAARLCRPLLLQALILWLAPYTAFDLPLALAVFLARGISLGSALYICRMTTGNIHMLSLPVLYAVISAIFVIFSYSLRDHHCIRPLRETSVHFLIAAGFALSIQILSPFIL